MAPAPSKLFPQFGCLFCSRSYAAINLLIKHQDRYLTEYCDVYYPDGTTQFHADSHPVPVLRYVRHEADRHPGKCHAQIVWRDVTFRPWVAPVVTAVRLESEDEKRRHTEQYRYLKAEQWIARLGEIVPVKRSAEVEAGDSPEAESDEESQEVEEEDEEEEEEEEEEEQEQEPQQEEEEEAHDEENEVEDEGEGQAAGEAETESDVEPSTSSPSSPSSSDTTDTTETTDSDAGMAMNDGDQAPSPSPTPSSSSSSSSSSDTPITPTPPSNRASLHRPISTRGKHSSAVSANVDELTLSSAGPISRSYFGRNATITVSSGAPPTSAQRTAQFYTPGNTMPVFVRLRIVLHPMAPAWIVPVPAPFGIAQTVELVRQELELRGIGGDGFPRLLGIAMGSGALIRQREWERVAARAGMVDVQLVWDVQV